MTWFAHSRNRELSGSAVVTTIEHEERVSIPCRLIIGVALIRVFPQLGKSGRSPARLILARNETLDLQL